MITLLRRLLSFLTKARAISRGPAGIARYTYNRHVGRIARKFFWRKR